jgi:hypothetical protein
VSKGLRYGRESHIKIGLATKGDLLTGDVGENNDGGVSQRRLRNSQLYNDCSSKYWIPGIWLPE